MLIDAHAHLDKYGDDLESVLEEIVQYGIYTISTAMDPPSYRRALEIGKRCDLVLPTFGIHPWRAPAYAGDLEELNGYIDQSPMLGEIGLDHHFVEDAGQYPAQRKVFEFFLDAAKTQGKILNLHTKGAEREVLDLLRAYGIERAIVHWYSGPLDVLDDLVSWGAYFTVGVEVLHTDAIRTIARRIPSRQLLTETDNPGGAKWLTKEIGMPGLLKEIVRGLGEVRKTTAEAIVRTVQENVATLIAGDPRLSGTIGRQLDEPTER